MASESIKLGSLDLESRRTGLQLQVSSSLQFAPSTEDASKKLLTLQTSTSLLAHQTWIQHAATIRFVISLQHGDGVEDSSTAEVIQTLRDTFQHDKFWQQWSLSPIGTQTSKDEDTGSQLMTIILEYSTKERSQHKPCLHKLSLDISPHEMQVPPCIDTRALDAVCLSMEVRRCQDRKRRKLDRSVDSGCTTPTAVDNFYLADDSKWSEQASCPFKSYSGPNRDATMDFNDDLLLELQESDSVRHRDKLILKSMSGKCENSIASTCQPLVRQRPLSVDHDRPEQGSDMLVEYSMLQLVNSAIKVSISGCTHRLPQGISPRNVGEFTSLREVAPAIWSPGCIAAVSSRAILLPTIDRALASLADKSSSPALRSTMHSLRSPGTDRQEINTLAQDAPAAKLWHMLRTGLYSVSVPERLRPTPALANAAYEGTCEGLELFRADARNRGGTAGFGVDDMLDADSEHDYDDALDRNFHEYFDEDHPQGMVLDGSVEHADERICSAPLDGSLNRGTEIIGCSTLHGSLGLPQVSDLLTYCMEEDDMLSVSESVSSLTLDEASWQRSSVAPHDNHPKLDGDLDPDLSTDFDVDVDFDLEMEDI